MRGGAIIATLLVLVAGCGDEKKSDLETRLEKDAKVRQLDVETVECHASGPKYDCKITLADKREGKYDVVRCGPSYDARAKPPPEPPAPVPHIGGDCEASKYVPQRQLALAIVRTQRKADCEKYWGKNLALDCRSYLTQGSPNFNAHVEYVQPRPDGTVEVELLDPEGPGGLAVRAREVKGKPVVAGLVNFPR
jgi:hypothetical protein